MHLQTLGGLVLEGSTLGRPKPLLMLTYLNLEGPKPRRHLGELFWPEAANPVNSLAVAVRQIRQAAAGVLQDDEMRLWTDLPCDALDLERVLRSGPIETALALYRGPFAEGAELAGWGAELEEWVVAKREFYGEQLQTALVKQAELEAAASHFAKAAQWAEAAIKVAGAPEPSPELWVRLYPLLVAGNSPLASTAHQQAASWQVELKLSAEEAKGRLRQAFVGRVHEQERLLNLKNGEWAWVRGGPGMGKTSLLRQMEHALSGLYLPARSGLPYATLEPLLGNEVREGYEGALLQRLSRSEGVWLLEDWERIDPQSQELLEKLRRLGSRSRVIIAAQQEPPLAVEVRIELSPLTATELQPYSGAFEATGGLPGLVGAFLREEPLESALEARLSGLSQPAHQLYSALTLLETPDPALVRQALGLEAGVLARSLDELLGLGLIEPSGQVRGRETALRALDAQPTFEASLALSLGRQLQGAAALPLFRKAKALWETEDLPKVQRAYTDWAQEVLRRGFPAQAAEVLAQAPDSLELGFLRARALERAGQFREALEVLKSSKETPEVLALQAALLWRLGRPQEAQTAAQTALEGEGEARAEACNTLGLLAFSSGQYEAALKQFRRATTLWSALGDKERWAGALNNQAMIRSELGEEAESAFQEALNAAKGNASLTSLVLLSLGRVRERQGDIERGQELYKRAASLAQEVGALATAARAWNNLGALHHRQNQSEPAKDAYETALQLAQKVGERLLLATVLANLAELTEDREAFEEALLLFERAGHQVMLERYRAEYESFIARSLGNSHA
jgi:tetratricopeptide (TPR) repeat protein